jgi:hypothetical protein
LREIDQSRAFSSHFPNCPSLMCSGTQAMRWFSSTRRSLKRVTATNQELTARWMSGLSHRQQCGYGWSYVSCRSSTPMAFRSLMMTLLASKTCMPW